MSIGRAIGGGLGALVTLKVVDMTLGNLARVNDNTMAKRKTRKKKRR